MQLWVTANKQKKGSILFSVISTVKNLVKSSWVRKRRSASCRTSAGRSHSWDWRSLGTACPPSTVRNCPNMLTLHTRSFSCIWAPARETWKGQNTFRETQYIQFSQQIVYRLGWNQTLRKSMLLILDIENVLYEDLQLIPHLKIKMSFQ